MKVGKSRRAGEKEREVGRPCRTSNLANRKKLNRLLKNWKRREGGGEDAFGVHGETKKGSANLRQKIRSLVKDILYGKRAAITDQRED